MDLKRVEAQKAITDFLLDYLRKSFEYVNVMETVLYHYLIDESIPLPTYYNHEYEFDGTYDLNSSDFPTMSAEYDNNLSDKLREYKELKDYLK